VAKVFVVNSSGHDLSAAEQFGQFTTLSEGKVNVFATDRVIAEFKEKMKDVAAGDYILISGYAALNVFASLIAIAATGQCNMLLFDFASRKYIVRTVTQVQFDMPKVSGKTEETEEEEINYNR